MSENFKKLITFFDKTNYFKGVVTLLFNNGEVTANVTVIKNSHPAKNLKIAFISDKNFYAINMPFDANFNTRLVGFDSKCEIYAVIYNSNNVVAVAPKTANENYLLSVINKNSVTYSYENEIKNQNLKEYDDEAISPYNYYENEHNLRNQNDNAIKRGSEEEKEEYCSQKFNYDETRGSEVESGNIFYDDEKLNEILNANPKNYELTAIFGGGRFCDVNNGKGNFYYVGITTFDNTPYYVLAVKSYYGGKTLENSFFIPLSITDMQGEGFLVIFKNAVTGEIVKPHQQLFS